MFIKIDNIVINLNNVTNFYKSGTINEIFFIRFEFNIPQENADYYYSIEFKSEQERDEVFKSILAFINKESNLLQI